MMTGVVEVDFQFTLEYFEYDRIVASDILNTVLELSAGTDACKFPWRWDVLKVLRGRSRCRVMSSRHNSSTTGLLKFSAHNDITELLQCLCRRVMIIMF